MRLRREKAMLRTDSASTLRLILSSGAGAGESGMRSADTSPASANSTVAPATMRTP